jgi:hypothetical protein
MYLTSERNIPIRLSGIIYLHRISDDRVGGTAVKNIKLFRGLVGERSMANVALVTTMWGAVSERVGAQREQELKTKDDFWGSMCRSGATCDRYNNTRKDGLRIVQSMMLNVPCVIQIQTELQRGISLEDTTAGKEVNDRIKEMAAKFEKVLVDLKNEIKQERDELKLRELRREQARAIQETERAKKAQEMINETRIALLQAEVNHLRNQSLCIVM